MRPKGVEINKRNKAYMIIGKMSEKTLLFIKTKWNPPQVLKLVKIPLMLKY